MEANNLPGRSRWGRVEWSACEKWFCERGRAKKPRGAWLGCRGVSQINL